MTDSAVRAATEFAAVFIAPYIAHSVGDHWVIAAPTVSASARVAGVEVTR
ncbi:hypothetical protein [Streptomyces sasae]|nr:hypothetical protein [Streptomyces sasae]